MWGLRRRHAGVVLAAAVAFGALVFPPPLGEGRVAAAAAAPRPPAPQSPKHHPIRHQPALSQVLGGVRQGKAAAPSVAPVGVSWTALGPKPIKGLSTYGDSAGRVTALAAKGSVVYAGTADGGVWKSTDDGGTWTPLTDSQVTLAIGAIAVDWSPSSTSLDTVYAGTGEANRCQDCMPSQGVLKSTDGGSTWTLLGQSTFTASTFYFSALAIDSTNTQRILAATTGGLFQSTDGGANWAQVSGTANARWDNVVQDPASPNLFWGALTTSCNTAPSYGQ
ncbi:MAG: hypothetical protein M3Z28_02550, partial [Candidatus Dormibacteraeota bacterium]|nr:hypothetical protein [Candidatus Dormibacteraeota bacterium]